MFIQGEEEEKEMEEEEMNEVTDKSPSKDGSGDEGAKGPLKQPPNVLVGKVGRLGSVRTLGQEKKSNEGQEPLPEPVPDPVPDQDMEASTVATGGHGTPPPPGTEPEVPPPQMSTHEIQSLPSSQEAASAAYAAYAGTQPTADYYQTATMAAPQAQAAYTYGAYAQTSAASQQPYDYSAYAQTGYGGYAQAYNTYLQQAAAAASYGGYSMAPSGQYYPASYQTYASYNPYGYYTSGTAAYNTSTAATEQLNIYQ